MLRLALKTSLLLALAVLPMGCASILPQHHYEADEEFVIPGSEGDMSGHTDFTGVPTDYWSHH